MYITLTTRTTPGYAVLLGLLLVAGLLPGQLIDHVDELLGLVLLLLLGHLLHGVGGRVLHVARDGVDATRGGQGAS